MNTCSEDLLCTVGEVTEMLKLLDVSKSSGPDGISARMLKQQPTSIAPSITALFNLSLQCNKPPREWKKFHVVPIPKRKSNVPTPANFRPISLLPILSKMLEKHFYRLISTLQKVICNFDIRFVISDASQQQKTLLISYTEPLST